ncbi:MAG: tetratricopeptide repeat protein [Deltaproteobacteria bacterium]|nr:tetratricopeptide repeat protein [Deltaproteobacteria bacterium]
MPTENVERKLAAILHADVKGYSRLMGEDEVGTLRTLAAYREVTDALIQQHRGRIVGTAGDSILAEFASAVDAVQCAVDIQPALKTRNADLPQERRMEFRIGINVGDVIVEGPQIYGDGVNIAARLETLAEGGGICLSGTVYDQVENKLTLAYEYLGEQTVKNIAKPVRVYRVTAEEESQKAKVKNQKPVLSPSTPLRINSVEGAKVEEPQPRRVRPVVFVLVFGSVLLVAGIIAVRFFPVLSPSPEPRATSTQAAPPLPDKPSIIVLPFVNMSGDPEQEYFSDGITEDITADLSKISGFFVIARNSAFTYKGKAVKVQEVSREMGVRYVLEGSVRKVGEQVRVTAQLIDGMTGGHVWSERYNRPLTDIFAVQDDIVQQLVTTLRVEVQAAEQERVRRVPTTNLTAYDAYLRGVEYLEPYTKEAIAKARQMFEQVIALDPQYAAAYALLSATYWRESVWNPDPQTRERALALAQQAVALDDTLSAAHLWLGMAYQMKTQHEPAIAGLEQAIALDPNSAEGYAGLGSVLNAAGRPVEAIGWLEKAMRFHPRYPFWYALQLGIAYRLTGRYAEAIATQKQVLLRNPNNEAPHVDLAVDYVEQWGAQLNQDPQTLEQALEAAQRAVALNDYWATHSVLGLVYLYQQQYEQAVAEVERAVALNPNVATPYAILADVLSRVGRADEALRAAEQALRLKPYTADSHLYPIGMVYAQVGRYTEALVPLQQFLTRYPNILGAHLNLAAVYSELGKEAEARAEAAEVLRLNPNFSLEVHKERVPIKDPVLLERHIAALRKAGLK